MANLAGILHAEAPTARERILACLHLENLSHLMMSSSRLRACCENSDAAEEVWRKAVQCLDSMNRLHWDDTGARGPHVEDPRFTEVGDADAFHAMSLRWQWTKLFKFQALCIGNLLSCFKIGGRSMHGYCCQWQAWSGETLSGWEQEHNALGIAAPRRSHLLQVVLIPEGGLVVVYCCRTWIKLCAWPSADSVLSAPLRLTLTK